MSEDKILSSMGLRPLEEVNKKDAEKELEVIQEQEEVEQTSQEMSVVDEEEKNLPANIDPAASENLKDIELAKQNIENIISLGDESIKEMVEIAKQSESPRAFEVVSTLMKTLLDANKDYVEMSTKKRYATEEQAPQTQVTNNNLIVSTADLLKMIKGDE